MSKINDRFPKQIFVDFVRDEVMTWRFVVSQFFMMPISSTGEVGIVGRTIGMVDWRDSMSNDMCGAGVGMRCGLKTPDNSAARISAFSLSVVASELSVRRRGGGESLIRSNDFVLRQRNPFVKERFCR